MKFATRHRARECALQALYSWQVSKNDIIDIATQFIEENITSNVDIAYFYEIYIGTATNASILDELMTPYISRNIESLSHIEHAVLRIALFELRQYPNIPYKVIINEAIELVKTFGAKDSYKFINGVLAKVALQIYHDFLSHQK